MSDLLNTTAKKRQNLDSTFKVSPFQAHGFVVQQKVEESVPVTKAQLWENYQQAKQLNQKGVNSSPEPIQAKLTIDQPGDKYEQEADSMAAQVMQVPKPELTNSNVTNSLQTRSIQPIQRVCSDCQEEKKEESKQEEAGDQIQAKEEVGQTPELTSVQRKMDSADDPQSGSNLESQLNGTKGSGSPLTDEVRSFMEPRFGADFSGVRVHTGSDAVQMNGQLNAQAFAHGSDIYFGAGKAPGKDALTAHELTHVVKQTSQVQSQSAPSGSLEASDPVNSSTIPTLNNTASQSVSRSNSMLRCKKENEDPLAEIQKGPMYDILPALAKLPLEIRNDEEAGGFVGGPRLVIAMRAVQTKFDKNLVNFLSINKKGLESLPPDQSKNILTYIGASDNNLQQNNGNNLPTPVSQLSTTEKFSKAVHRAIEKHPDQLANRLDELLSPQSIAMMVSFTAVYIASQVTPAGWVADGIGLGLILASAIMIGPEVVTIVEHIIGFCRKASNAKTDLDIDLAAEDLAIAVTKLEADVVTAILLHKVGKAGTKAVKTYVKPSPALVDAVTPDGRIVRVPEEQISKNVSESRGAVKEGGKVSLVDAIRSLGDDFLDQCEGRGNGHTIREHVSITNAELVRRANKNSIDTTTFESKSSATAAIRYNLRVNAADIAAWLEQTESSTRKTCDAQHPMRIGRGVKDGRNNVNYDLGVSRIILVKDPTMPLKFRILTGFPLLDP